MNELISPKYQMKLVKSVYDAIWAEYSSYKEVELYIKKWHEYEDSEQYVNGYWENFEIVYKDSKKKNIDLLHTLHNVNGETLLKIAIDLGVDTPDFIPSVPTFRNKIKSEYETAYNTFTKAYQQIEADPSIAIGLANSALESIIKEILKDNRFKNKITGNETLYRLTITILKEFNISGVDHPQEIKTIGSSFIAISQAIEKLRSDKTNFHGKTVDDLLIKDPIYTYFVINCVSTVGLFIDSYYKTKYPKPELSSEPDIDLPF